MLGRPDSGTSVDSVRLGAASNSMPPARTCDSISGSPPSWLLGKTVTLSRPDDCCADRARRLDQPNRQGMGVRRIDAQLELELGVRHWLVCQSAAVAKAADAAPSTPLRVIFIFWLSRARYRAFGQFRSNRPRPQASDLGAGHRRAEQPARCSDGYRFCDRMKPFCGTDETALKQIRAYTSKKTERRQSSPGGIT